MLKMFYVCVCMCSCAIENKIIYRFLTSTLDVEFVLTLGSDLSTGDQTLYTLSLNWRTISTKMRKNFGQNEFIILNRCKLVGWHHANQFENKRNRANVKAIILWSVVCSVEKRTNILVWQTKIEVDRTHQNILSKMNSWTPCKN